MDALIIRPHLSPRSGRDAALVIATGLLFGSGLIGVATVVAFLVYRGTDQPVLGYGAWMVFYLLILLGAATTVHWLRLDATGISFGRRIGAPRFLPWSDVHRIRRATPREVIVRGWLLPPLPAREGTRSMTAKGHYAIEYGTRKVAYYPPADELEFLAAVRQWCPGALRETEWH